MAKRTDAKSQLLREHGTLNPRPQLVSDGLFHGSEFFDPRDLVQVKYEMLRRVETEGLPVNQSAAAFGFSRPSFYQAQASFQQGGLPASSAGCAATARVVDQLWLGGRRPKAQATPRPQAAQNGRCTRKASASCALPRATTPFNAASSAADQSPTVNSILLAAEVPACMKNVPYSGPPAPPTVCTSVIPTDLNNVPMSLSATPGSFASAALKPRSMLAP